MKLTIEIPEEVLDPVRDKLPPPEMGLLEAVAVDAILAFLVKLEDLDIKQD
jgi:hypothetical protein